MTQTLTTDEGSALFRIGQPVHVFKSVKPYLVIAGHFDEGNWIWLYQISDGSDYWYTERSLSPFHKIKAEMKQLIRRVA